VRGLLLGWCECNGGAELCPSSAKTRKVRNTGANKHTRTRYDLRPRLARRGTNVCGSEGERRLSFGLRDAVTDKSARSFDLQSHIYRTIFLRSLKKAGVVQRFSGL